MLLRRVLQPTLVRTSHATCTPISPQDRRACFGVNQAGNQTGWYLARHDRLGNARVLVSAEVSAQTKVCIAAISDGGDAGLGAYRSAYRHAAHPAGLSKT